MMNRRHALACLASCPAPFLAEQAPAQTQPLAATALLTVPGPRNSVSLPLELAQRLGLDAEAGLPLRLSFVGGGGVAIQELCAGNAEFAVFGLPAMVRANVLGKLPPMVAVAAIDDLPLYTLVVRMDLRGKVRSICDLAQRTLGVHSNSLQVKTTSHQLAEYLLRRSGVEPGQVRFLAAGQSWETQSSMLASHAVDGSLCDEPFATRLMAQGLAFRLFATGDAADAASVPGTGFLRAVLVTLQRHAQQQPKRVQQAVALVQRTLAWMASHDSAAFADALGMQGAERDSMLEVARVYPSQYSDDARFSVRQLAETERFIRESNPDVPGIGRVRLADMVLDRWAGGKA